MLDGFARPTEVVYNLTLNGVMKVFSKTSKHTKKNMVKSFLLLIVLLQTGFLLQ